MAYAVCKNHPFVDGNKRTAVISMIVLLRLNGVSLVHTQRELVSLALEIANDCVGYEGIVVWVKAHIG